MARAMRPTAKVGDSWNWHTRNLAETIYRPQYVKMFDCFLDEENGETLEQLEEKINRWVAEGYEQKEGREIVSITPVPEYQKGQLLVLTVIVLHRKFVIEG